MSNHEIEFQTEDKEKRQHRPLLSRCSIGSGKWFWVTYADLQDVCDGTVHASGTATTAAEAEEQARAAIRTAFKCDSPTQYATYYARHVHHQEALKRRAAKASKATETTTPEFVYRDWTSDYDGSWGSTPYRIVKKTAKRIYVEWDRRSWEDQGRVLHDVRTVALDREQLESTGRAWCRRCRDVFCTMPYEERHQPSKPQFLKVLGLEVGCNKEALDVAYRTLAKKFHPDHGGDAEDFKQLQAAYEQALQMVT